MSTGYTIAPRAVIEHEALKRQAISAVKHKFMSADQAFRIYADKLVALLREARQEVDDDRMITTRCTDCNEIHTMRSTVTLYQCSCNPHKDRFAFNERFIVEAEES
jgi:phosphoenolpyruvate-protein kinase (PTS system EI component)